MQFEHGNALFVVGLLLIGAITVARIATKLGLPAMTGQFVAGLTVGMVCAPLVAPSVPILSLFRQGLGAVLLFWIGSQLTIARIRPRARAVASLAAAALVSVLFCAVALAVPLPLFAALPLADVSLGGVAVVSLVLSATSPTVIAVISRELRAEGGLARTALDASVMANAALALLLILGGGFSTGGVATPRQADSLVLIRDLSAGLALGVAFGVIVARSPRRAVGALQIAWALIALTFLRQQLIHAEAAMMAAALVAGIAFASSVQSPNHPVLIELPKAVPLISTALFAFAGAVADLGFVVVAGLPAAVLAIVRSLSLWLGSWLAGTIARDPTLRRFGFAPLLPQAGFSMALLGALHDASELSTTLISLVLAVVVINELVMPPIFRLALRLSESVRPTGDA